MVHCSDSLLQDEGAHSPSSLKYWLLTTFTQVPHWKLSFPKLILCLEDACVQCLGDMQNVLGSLDSIWNNSEGLYHALPVALRGTPVSVSQFNFSFCLILLYFLTDIQSVTGGKNKVWMQISTIVFSLGNMAYHS